MYAFSYLAPNKPFLRADSRRDGYGLGTLRLAADGAVGSATTLATLTPRRPCKLLPLIASVGARDRLARDDGNSGHPTWTETPFRKCARNECRYPIMLAHNVRRVLPSADTCVVSTGCRIFHVRQRIGR